MTSPPPKWQEIASTKRSSLLATIPPQWLIPTELMPSDSFQNITTFPNQSGFLTPEEVQITASSASDIVHYISTHVWTAEKVTLAFCKAAAVAHQLTNCLTETLFPSALETAKALDDYFTKTGKLKGPLHGVPISIKDNFQIAGKASSAGFVGWANDVAEADSSMVGLLKRQGAVVYVKTNVPTAMMIAETVNNLFGRTLNPLNRELTPGGSSGGEAALITFRGSPLGVGTDIGGSLRIPAACCGIFTLKPSFGRFPHSDTKSGMAGQEAVVSINGPMARSLKDIELFSKTVIDSQPWLIDPKCIPIPWRTVELPKKLKIGVLRHDGVVMPTPPVRRAIGKTVEKLRSAGHEIVEWSNEGHKQAGDLLGKMFLADGGKTIKSSLDISGEPWRPEMSDYAEATELGVHEMWKVQSERTKFAWKYLERWNACEGLDAILGPTTPYATVKHGDWKHVGYTCIWNILDYSTVSFPTGFVADKEIDIIPPGQHSFGELDSAVQSTYDAATVHGMPISLQLTCRRLEEEKVLAVTEKVLEALK